jgi:aminoglycoside phosphotransferase (APT) family kinase protein
MPPDNPRDEAALHVPGRGDLEIHRLGAGLMNETYRVLRDGNVYAMRLAMSNRDDLGLDRAWEARVLEGAVAADLAPALEYCDPQRGVLIARWVDGRFWTPADAQEPKNISRMAGFMRRIHGLKMPATVRAMSPRKWIDYYGAALSRGSKQGDVSAETSVQPADTRGEADTGGARYFAAAAARQLAALAALPGVDPVLCHSDLHTLNLIDRGGSLILLDWEYAHASDPLWDLAGWGANNDFEAPISHELLASYLGRPPSGDEYLRLQLLSWLYDYVCLLWSELYLNLPRAAQADVAVQGDAAMDDVSARARELAARLDASKAAIDACK